MKTRRVPLSFAAGMRGPTIYFCYYCCHARLILSKIVRSLPIVVSFCVLWLCRAREMAPAEQPDVNRRAGGGGGSSTGGRGKPESAAQGEEGGREGEEAVALPEGGQAAVLQRRRGDAVDRHGGQHGAGEGRPHCNLGAHLLHPIQFIPTEGKQSLCQFFGMVYYPGVRDYCGKRTCVRLLLWRFRGCRRSIIPNVANDTCTHPRLLDPALDQLTATTGLSIGPV